MIFFLNFSLLAQPLTFCPCFLFWPVKRSNQFNSVTSTLWLQQCSGGVVGYHVSLTHWRSRVRFSARISPFVPLGFHRSTLSPSRVSAAFLVSSTKGQKTMWLQPHEIGWQLNTRSEPQGPTLWAKKGNIRDEDRTRDLVRVRHTW